MNDNLTYSKDGLHLTEQFEGCRLSAYQDQVGVWTIGFGHTGPDVHSGLTCTLEQAEAWLQQDIQWAASAVRRYVSIPLTQGEFDALVDFTFNLGVGSLEHSTLLKLVNQKDLAYAAEQFDKWDRAGGKVVAGLLRRRLAEKKEFEGVAYADSGI